MGQRTGDWTRGLSRSSAPREQEPQPRESHGSSHRVNDEVREQRVEQSLENMTRPGGIKISGLVMSLFKHTIKHGILGTCMVSEWLLCSSSMASLVLLYGSINDTLMTT